MVSVVDGVGVQQLSCHMQVVDHLKGRAVEPWCLIGWIGRLEDAGTLVSLGRGTDWLVPRGTAVSREGARWESGAIVVCALGWTCDSTRDSDDD